MRRRRGISTKTLVALLSLVLLLGCSLGGTLAWLSDSTDPVINTFTVGDIKIELTETPGEYKIVPGVDIAKDPKVTVEANSEACWLFVKIEESANWTDGLTYGKTSCRVEDNELMLSGPSLMKGYYKDPAGTAAVIKNGWLKTGDLVRYDDDGYFYITGRKKNVIILSNGENVNPEEIEKILNTSDDILECMVYSDKKGILADIYTENKKSAAAFIKK